MDVIDFCKDHNLRITRSRIMILKVLSESSDHPDVAELHRRLIKRDPRISLSTVYRTLSLLEKKGILKKHSFCDGPSRFEKSGEEHDHLINIETGDVIEFRSDEIEKLQEDIAYKFGFSIVWRKLEIYVKPLKLKRK